MMAIKVEMVKALARMAQRMMTTMMVIVLLMRMVDGCGGDGGDCDCDNFDDGCGDLGWCCVGPWRWLCHVFE